MKTIVSLTWLGLVALWSSLVFAEDAQQKMLAEMEKCAVCKHMAEKPELMKDMTWETHKIEDGMLCLTTVPKEKKKEFDALGAKMMQAINKVKADAKQGKEVELCSLCAGTGELHKSGAKMQYIDTHSGAIHIVTSDDAAIVKKIHAFADKAIAEQKKMQQHEERTASLR
ncbi:MAG TPA: hypothetical protein VGK58_23850 [Lacipirellulaceae bacterium]